MISSRLSRGDTRWRKQSGFQRPSKLQVFRVKLAYSSYPIHPTNKLHKNELIIVHFWVKDEPYYRITEFTVLRSCERSYSCTFKQGPWRERNRSSAPTCTLLFSKSDLPSSKFGSRKWIHKTLLNSDTVDATFFEKSHVNKFLKVILY